MERRESGDGSATPATERPDAADAPRDLRERVPLHRRDVERVAVPDREDPGRVAPGSRRRPSRSAGSARQVGEPVVADRRAPVDPESPEGGEDRKSTRLNSSHTVISYAVFCLKKKKNNYNK